MKWKAFWLSSFQFISFHLYAYKIREYELNKCVFSIDTQSENDHMIQWNYSIFFLLEHNWPLKYDTMRLRYVVDSANDSGKCNLICWKCIDRLLLVFTKYGYAAYRDVM